MSSRAVVQARLALAVELHGLRALAEIFLAQDRQVAVAIEAMPAMRIPRQDDVFALARSGTPATDVLDDARCLMAEHDRHRIAQRAVDHFQIGVAEAGGADPHQHVGRPSGAASTCSIASGARARCRTAALYFRLMRSHSLAPPTS